MNHNGNLKKALVSSALTLSMVGSLAAPAFAAAPFQTVEEGLSAQSLTLSDGTNFADIPIDTFLDQPVFVDRVIVPYEGAKFTYEFSGYRTIQPDTEITLNHLGSTKDCYISVNVYTVKDMPDFNGMTDHLNMDHKWLESIAMEDMYFNGTFSEKGRCFTFTLGETLDDVDPNDVNSFCVLGVEVVYPGYETYYHAGYTFKVAPPEKVTFQDVPNDAYFADSVNWAVENNITKGVSGDRFAPDKNCTEEEILTFLWRAKGCPQVSAFHPFEKVDAFAEDAVRWAYQQGIVDAAFSPRTNCTRANAVTYMYKAAGRPSNEYSGKFTDIDNADLGHAVQWALENNVTKGTGDTTFSPNVICSRGQIVTFLQRAFG